MVFDIGVVPYNPDGWGPPDSPAAPLLQRRDGSGAAGGIAAHMEEPLKPQVRIYEVPVDAFENDYVEEPLPEEEQVRPPAEDEVADTVAESRAAGEVAEVGASFGDGEAIKDASA